VAWLGLNRLRTFKHVELLVIGEVAGHAVAESPAAHDGSWAPGVAGVATMGKRKPSTRETTPTSDRLSIRLDLVSGARIGPGKVAVLEEIARSGSISAAGRALRMSYRRTWELVEDLNRSLGTPVVETAAGGSGGGGAVLTRAGKAVVERYRAIEVDTALAARKHLLALSRACSDK
jgi:molybdate transport system regulatory protein